MNTTLRSIRTRTLIQISTTCRVPPQLPSCFSRASVPSSCTCRSPFQSIRHASAPRRENARSLHTFSNLDSAIRKRLLSQSLFVNTRRIHSAPPRQNQRKGNADTEPEPEPDFDPNAPLDWRKWSLRTTAIVVLGVGGSLYYVAHLERVPETGRWRFMNILPRHEKKLAEEEYSEFLSEFKGKLLPQSHPIVQEVRRIVLAILEANNLGSLKAPDHGSFVPAAAQEAAQQDGAEANWDPDSLAPGMDLSVDRGAENVATRSWNLLVVDDFSIVNAAAGHGNIIVFTGILPVAKDDQGLAAILSHEMAHVVLRHKAESMSSALVLSSLVYLLSFLGLDANLGQLFLSYLYTLPNSRTMELEADIIGLRLAAKACFDPGAAPDVQRRLSQSEKNQRLNVDFLYTHPTGARRVKLLIDALPEAYAIRAGSGACAMLQDDYTAFKSAVDMLDIPDNLSD